MKRLIFVSLAITVAAAGCGKEKLITRVSHTNFDTEVQNDYTAQVNDVLSEANFSETGNITNWDAAKGEHASAWMLTYEQPGQPAIAVKLKPENDSICVVANEEFDCAAILTNEFNGKRLHVQGVRDGDVVIVKRITF